VSPEALAPSPCPHCRSLAPQLADPLLRWRCAVCGGPVVPAGPGMPRTHRELARLVTAQRLRAAALGWMVAAVAFAVAGVLAGALAALLVLGSSLGAGVLAAIAASCAIGSFWCRRRARRRRDDAAASLEEAWEQVAAEVLAAGRGLLTADEVARTMRTRLPHAESLLSRLSASGDARVLVGEDAELLYGAEAPISVRRERPQ